MGVVQTPFGAAPRCRAHSKRSGRQCARPARRGFPVCSIHGAGSPKREQEGTRTNPRLASLKTGARAVTATVIEAVGGLSSIKGREQEYLRDRAALHDIDPVLARIRAVSDLLVDNLALARPEADTVAPLLASLRLHVESLERLGRLKGVVHLTVKQVDALADALFSVLQRYVPPQQFENVAVEIGHAIDAALDVPRVTLAQPTQPV